MDNRILYDKIMKVLWEHEPQAADALDSKLWEALDLGELPPSSESSTDENYLTGGD